MPIHDYLGGEFLPFAACEEVVQLLETTVAVATSTCSVPPLDQPAAFVEARSARPEGLDLLYRKD